MRHNAATLNQLSTSLAKARILQAQDKMNPALRSDDKTVTSERR